ncbi:taste receptor type 2 member 4-like [Hyla sarda]|uniref:taste receptor type 2 member 4-like n=1 Tax=Hyla sarda TaxID=327740 RepID=UPI0024C3A9B2|nr:taste receptor type 2 member 4-like [Hyla sarda]
MPFHYDLHYSLRYKISPYTSRNLFHLPSVQITNTPGEMTSYIENNNPLLHLSLVVSTEIAFILGLMTTVFIITVYVMDWRKERTMSTSDQVIVSIMIFRMISQSLLQLRLFWKLFCTMCSPIYDFIIQITSISSICSSFWLSTLLGIIFYLKISNIHSDFFLQMRRLFSKKILYFIMASLLVSIGQTLVTYLVKYSRIVFSNSTNDHVHEIYLKPAVFFGSMFVLLFIRFFSSLFLITSLYLHIRHMRCNKNVTNSLDPYYRIIKYIAGSFFTFVLSVIINLVAERFYYLLRLVINSFSLITFETLHSILLIYVTPKLKNQLSRILKSLSNCWMKREEPEDLEMTVTTGYVNGVSKL